MLLTEQKGYKFVYFYCNKMEIRASFKVKIAKGMNQSSSTYMTRNCLKFNYALINLINHFIIFWRSRYSANHSGIILGWQQNYEKLSMSLFIHNLTNKTYLKYFTVPFMFKGGKKGNKVLLSIDKQQQ